MEFVIVRSHGNFPDQATAQVDANLRHGPGGYIRVMSKASFEIGVQELSVVESGRGTRRPERGRPVR